MISTPVIVPRRSLKLKWSGGEEPANLAMEKTVFLLWRTPDSWLRTGQEA